MAYTKNSENTNFCVLKNQYRYAQKALYEIEQASALKSKNKVKKRMAELFYWTKDENINEDVWDLIRSELRRIGEENELNLILMLKQMEDSFANNPIDEESLEKVGAIDWMAENEE